MGKYRRIAVLFSTVMLSFGYGYISHARRIFPDSEFRKLKQFILGVDDEQSNLWQRMVHDAGIRPERFLDSFPEKAADGTSSLDVAGINSRREHPLFFATEEHSDGMRAIFGFFDFEDAGWGGVLIDDTLRVVHRWKFPAELKRHPYAVHLFPDGSVVFNDENGPISRLDYAGKILWTNGGEFHHTITPADADSFWTFGGQYGGDHELLRISLSDGQVLHAIKMSDVRARNPMANIFHLQVKRAEFVGDMWHGNDIEPLSATMATRFPQFAAGDLLISFRTHNLIFVLDPDSLEVKWWRIGPWDRQHDPDWEENGQIAVFSNNATTRGRNSDIITIDPATFAATRVVDGERFSLLSTTNCRHQKTVFGTRLIISSWQGWVLEVSDSGEIVSSFVNNYSERDKKALFVAHAFRVKKSYFDREFWHK